MQDLDVEIVKKNIETLEKLENSSSLEPELALKLALIECCGWVEENMQWMISEYIDRKVNDLILRNEVKKSIYEMNYGFNYKKFKFKLIATLGQTEVVKIETIVSSYNDSVFDFEHFKNCLAELKSHRDECAHTYTRTGAGTGTVPGFSKIVEQLDYVKKGLDIFATLVSAVADAG